MKIPALEAAFATHTGLLREHNEDSLAVSTQYGLAMLADGMGGYNAGEVASGMAVAVLKNDLEADLAAWYRELTRHGIEKLHGLVQARISRTNLSIYQSAQTQTQYAGMGTTLVLTVFLNDRVTVAHIGDSRLYRLRQDTLEPLTRDHSYLQEQMDIGLLTPEQARHSHNKNLLTRALGVDIEVMAEIRDYQTEPEDVYLLCSDGLTDMLTDAEIAHALLQNRALGFGKLQQAADDLIRRANDNGGRDNVSVVLLRVLDEYVTPRGLFSRLLGL